MSENTVLDEGVARVREAFDSIDDEVAKIRKDLKRRRVKLAKQLSRRRGELGKSLRSSRRDFEKRTRQLRRRVEKNPAVKRFEAARRDTRERFEQGVADLLGSLQIASKSDLQRIDRKLSQLGRKLKEIEASPPN